MSRKLNVLNVNVPADSVAGSRVTAVASSGDQVVFTLPKGVAPGTRLQMIPSRQVMKRGAIPVTPMHPMANGLNVLANSNALHLRNDPRKFYKPTKSGSTWGKNFVIHAQQSTGHANYTKEEEIQGMPVAFVAGESHASCSLCRLLCWPRHAFTIALYDELENEIATMSRSCVVGCATPFFICNDNKVTVRLADGTPLGSIEQRRGFVCCNRALEVRDHEERLMYTFAAPMQTAPTCFPGCRTYRMKLHDVKGDHVGNITNSFNYATMKGFCSSLTCGACSGYCPKCCVTPDKYTLSYPPEATVEDKLLLLSTNFLLDFMLFA